MNGDRLILHVDCNAYFASVEELIEPELKKVPMAICGDPEIRHGIILAKNELAKGFGVKTAETIWAAKKKCPELVLRPPRRGLYSEYCEKVNSIYERYTGYIERAGIDESYLDCTNYMPEYGNDPERLARDILKAVPAETGLTVSVGVSWNKVFAKLGSDLKKPNAYTLISRENYKEVVWPLPASALLFVGRATDEALSKMGIRTIGDIARTGPDALQLRFGKMGHQLYAYASGLDDEPVKRLGETEDVHSIGNGITFKRDLLSMEDVHTAVTALSDEVATRMRREGVKCGAVQVTIKDPQFKVITRQRQMEPPTFLASDLSRVSMGIIESNWKIDKPIRMLAVTAMKLIAEDEAAVQISLFDSSEVSAGSKKREKLEKAVDKIRDKYGAGIIKPASIYRNDLGIDGGDPEE